MQGSCKQRAKYAGVVSFAGAKRNLSKKTNKKKPPPTTKILDSTLRIWG